MEETSSKISIASLKSNVSGVFDTDCSFGGNSSIKSVTTLCSEPTETKIFETDKKISSNSAVNLINRESYVISEKSSNAKLLPEPQKNEIIEKSKKSSKPPSRKSSMKILSENEKVQTKITVISAPDSLNGQNEVNLRISTKNLVKTYDYGEQPKKRKVKLNVPLQIPVYQEQLLENYKSIRKRSYQNLTKILRKAKIDLTPETFDYGFGQSMVVIGVLFWAFMSRDNTPKMMIKS
jgi:hypothetical protein